MARIYVSLPLSGPSARYGRDVLRGAELALEQAAPAGVEPVVLDSGGEDRDGQAAANALRAAGDPEALAYLGDFHSSQVMASAPVLAAAGLLAVAPVATFIGLRGGTLVRLSPHDGVAANAIAEWMREAGVGEVLVVHDHDPGYGWPVGVMCSEAARALGLRARIRPVWDHDEPMADDLGDAGAVLYVGVAGSGAVAMFDELHALRPDLWLLGSDGIALPWLARELGPGPAARLRLFVAQRATFTVYGLEAMSLILDAVAAGGGDRAATVAAARATRDRRSPLGRYSIDEDGLTTTTAYGRMAVVGDKLVWDVEVPAAPPVRALSGGDIARELAAFTEALAAVGDFSGAVLLAQGDDVLHVSAHGLARRSPDVPNRPETRFNLGSMNKMFTAVSIARLVADGRLDFADTVGTHLPDLPSAFGSKVTVHHLLTHTSGLGDFFNPRFEERRATLRTVDDYLGLFLDDPLSFEPGERFSYSNAGFILLGAIVESATGRDYFEVVRDFVYGPAGMSASDHYELDTDAPDLAVGYTRRGRSPFDAGPPEDNRSIAAPRGEPAGGGFSTVGDMHRFGRALLGHRLLPPDVTESLLTGKVDLGEDTKYAYGFFEHHHDGLRSLGHGGGFAGVSAGFSLYPDAGYTVVALANMDPPTADRVVDHAHRLIAIGG